MLKMLDGQQDRMDERLEVLASLMPGKEEPMNTTVVDEVSCIQAITSEMDEGTFLRNHIVEKSYRRNKTSQGRILL